MSGGRSVAVPDDGLEMLDGLGDSDAGDVNALGPLGAKHNLAGEALLNPTLWQGRLKEGPHDGSGFLFREGSGHERIFQRLHDGAIQTVPGIGSIDALSPDAVDPLGYLGLHGHNYT